MRPTLSRRIRSCFAVGLALALVACTPEEGPSATDTDGDGALDGSDGVVDTQDTDRVVDDEGFTVWSEVLPTFEASTLQHPTVGTVELGLPADGTLRGLVFVFHGSGGGPDVVESTEMVSILNALADVGVGFAAFGSDNRSSGQFDESSVAANNADWANLVAVRQSLGGQGVLAETTPLVFWGYSRGAAFASLASHPALEADWPLQAVVLQQGAGGSSAYGATAAVDQLVLLAEHDATIDNAAVLERVDQHQAEGNDSLALTLPEQSLDPTRFVRTGYFTEAQSEQVFELAVSEGYWTEAGVRAFEAADIEDTVAAFTALDGVIYPKPVRAQLNVVLATHALNGSGARSTADFVAARVE